jgi:hypothetical protein
MKAHLIAACWLRALYVAVTAGKQDHGRPAALAMSTDGRLFLSNDANGDIVWIAPTS